MTRPTLTAGQVLTVHDVAYVAELEARLADQKARIAALQHELDTTPTRSGLRAERRRTHDARTVAARLRAENTRLRDLIRAQRPTTDAPKETTST